MSAGIRSPAGKTRPVSITIISWIFIGFCSIAVLGGLLPPADDSAAKRAAEYAAEHPLESGLIHQAVRGIPILCGVFMLYGHNWARWLLAVWVGFHIVVAWWHTPLAVVIHVLLFLAIIYFLFRASASAYFRGTRDVASSTPK
jgi:hypothetical protein